jgi:predicted TIM-barrel fold metal-dependent hydrolase
MSDRSIAFVETHHHLWDLKQLRYDWLMEPGIPSNELGDYKRIRADWGPEKLFREFYGQNVTKSVHVEAAYSGPDPVEETRWLESVRQRYGKPNAFIVAWDMTSADAEHTLVRHLEASSCVRGVRVRNHRAAVESPRFRGAYRMLGKYGLSYELNDSPGGLLAGLDVMAEHPDVPVMLGHAGYPIRRDPDYFRQWADELRTLATMKHVTCKISGLGMADHGWTVDSIRPWVLECLEIFGTERCMFGTNWPVDSLFSSYFELVDAYRIILRDAGLATSHQRLLLASNAERVYRI